MLKKFLRKKESTQESETLEMCRKCYSFRYANEWHFEKPEHLLEDEKITVEFSQCPACVEEALALYDMEYV